MLRSHKLFAILAVAGFAGHLYANLLLDIVFWLPEYVWFASLVFAVLAIYTGAASASRSDGADRGMAIASAVIGAIVLLGLVYSGVTWLFLVGEEIGPPLGA